MRHFSCSKDLGGDTSRAPHDSGCSFTVSGCIASSFGGWVLVTAVRSFPEANMLSAPSANTPHRSSVSEFVQTLPPPLPASLPQYIISNENDNNAHRRALVRRTAEDLEASRPRILRNHERWESIDMDSLVRGRDIKYEFRRVVPSSEWRVSQDAGQSDCAGASGAVGENVFAWERTRRRDVASTTSCGQFANKVLSSTHLINRILDFLPARDQYSLMRVCKVCTRICPTRNGSSKADATHI
jgi:hypothetical protein